MSPEEISDALSCAKNVELVLSIGGGIQATVVGQKGGGDQCKNTAVVTIDLAWGICRDIFHCPVLLPFCQCQIRGIEGSCYIMKVMDCCGKVCRIEWGGSQGVNEPDRLVLWLYL